MGQMTAACVVLGALKAIGKIDFPDMTKSIPRKIFPLPLLYLLNLIFGLKSTKVIINFIKLIIRLTDQFHDNSLESFTSNVHSSAAFFNSADNGP